MKKLTQIAIAVVVVASMTGCASTKAYFVDRGRDALDVITLTAGDALGAKVRLGPLHAGVYMGEDRIGLRGGSFLLATKTGDELPYLVDGDFTFIAMDIFDPPWMDVARSRGKLYEASTYRMPYFELPDNCGHTHYYTQMEIAVGAGVGLHLGFNPGELLDFILGWFGIDIFYDDIEMRTLKKTSNQASQAIGAEAAPQPER